MKTPVIWMVFGVIWLFTPVEASELDLEVGSIEPPGRYDIHVQGKLDGTRKGSIAEGERIIYFEIGELNDRDSFMNRVLATVWQRNQTVRDQKYEIRLLENPNDQKFVRVTVNSVQTGQFHDAYPAIFHAQIKDESVSEELIADVVATAMSYRPYIPVTEPLDWEVIRNQPATVSVLNMKPVDLKPGTGKKDWVRIPLQLREFRTQIFTETGTTNGVADFEITGSGYLLVACNYDYQGNKSGDWDDERWNQLNFKQNGWQLLTDAEMNGPLVTNENRAHVIFIKKVDKGERGRLRCNKYDPPYFILPTSQPTPLTPSELAETQKN